MSGAAPLRHQNRALTALRGLAALWVVGHHYQFELSALGYSYAGGFFTPGYTAVDVFFVLSGFVITAVHRDIGPGNRADFFIRRVFRIYPLHLFVLALLLALWLQSPVQDPTERLGDLPIVALLLQPYLIHGLTWNIASWSVGVELLCYLLFPLAMPWLRRLALPHCLLALLAALLFARHVQSEAVWGWAAVLRGLAGFALGMLVQQTSLLLPKLSARMADLLGLAAFAGLILSLALGNRDTVPLWSALLVFALAAEAGRLSRLLGCAPLYGLGLISYSVYLLHPTIANLFFLHLPPHSLPFGHAVQAMVWTALLLACVLLAACLTWALVEEPARRLGGHLGRRLRNRSAAACV